MSQVVVWVQDLVSGAPNWLTGSWRIVNRLIPDTSDMTDGSMGRGAFRMLRGSRDDGGGPILDTWYPTRGQYVVIAGSGTASPFGDLLWAGQITGINPQPLQHSTDEVGEVEAVELGSVLAQTAVANLRQGTSTLLADPLPNNPTINLTGSNGEVIGNMRTGSPPYFEALPENCGSGAAALWNHYAVLEHVLTYAAVGTLVPPLSLSMASGLATYLAATTANVVELNGLSIKDVVDLMAGAASGMSWRIIPNAGGWTINVASASDTGIGDFPAATAVVATLNGNDIDYQPTESGLDTYDAVEVVGAPIVCCGTVSPIDGTAGFGWSSAAQTAFLAAASAEAGYAALTPESKWARNRAVRKGAALQDVFVRFDLLRYSPTTDLQCKSIAGVPTGGSTQNLTPLVDWDGTTATVSATEGSVLYLPTAKLLRQIPWPSGKSGAGADSRTDTAKGQPSYLLPIVLRHTTSGDAWVGWSDMLHPPNAKWPIPTVSVEDRGASIRIEYDQPEVLALNRWTGAATSEYSPELTTSFGATDAGRLVMTVAVESGQRVKARVLRPGITEAQVRNVLRIERPDLHCWLVRARTIVGLKGDGTPDEVAADTFTRNDFATAQALAEQAAAFAFRPRTCATITVTDPTNPPAWATIGALISDVQEQRSGVNTVAHTLDTVVRGIRQVWNPRQPRLVVTTDYPNGPGTVGGAPSVSLGGSVTSSLQRTRMEVGEVRRDVQRAPISPGAQGAANGLARVVIVTQTAHAFTAGKYIAYSSPNWVLASNLGAYAPLAYVVRVIDANNVEAVFSGYYQIASGTYTDFTTYYLTAAGAVTTVAPVRPDRRVIAHYALTGGLIHLPGPSTSLDHNHTVAELWDVDLTTVPPVTGDVLTWDSVAAVWEPLAPTSGLGSRAALSVIGRAANSVGAAADIVASTTGDVLHMGASALQWGPIGTASFQAASVTAAKIGTDVVLDTLNDVTIASVAALNFLRYDLASTQWKNYDLGPIAYAPATTSLFLDGGGAGTASKVILSHVDGSRFILSGDGTPNSTIEFKLSGDIDVGSEVVARIRSPSASEVAFYDQGTSTISDGTKVLSWMCNSSAASRSFRFLVPLDVIDSGGSAYLRLAAASTAEWDLKTAAGAKFFSFHTTGSTYGFNLIRAENAIDLNGKLLYMSGATAGLPYISGTSGQMNLRVGTSGIIEIAPDTTSVIRMGASGSTHGFFGGLGTARVAVSAPAAITAIGGADATYSANEQTLLNALFTDVTNLRSTLNSLRNALNGYNLV